MSKSNPSKPGDLITINFDPQAGREQAGRRPALVVSEASYNSRSGLALICPITNQIKGYPFEVILPDDCVVHGAVLSDHVKSADLHARKFKHVGAAPREVLETVRAYIALLVGAK